MTALKTMFFMLLVPGLLLVLLPCALIGADVALFSFGVFHWLAVPFWSTGAAMLIWCAWAFTVRGKGTPSPTDPPKELVVDGLYHIVRNPIYVGALLFLLGYVFWYPTLSILVMPVLFAVGSHLFILFYEEPHLRKIFGSRYKAYCQAVPRWMPRRSRME